MEHWNIDEGKIPFKATFGKLPPRLVGRIEETSQLAKLVMTGSLYSAIIFEGPRGVGKTVMLSELGNVLASKYGWININVNANEDMLIDILDQLYRKTKHLAMDKPKEITGFNFWQFGANFKTQEQEHGWRYLFENIIDELSEKGIPIFITVDEIHREVKELRTFCEVIQHCFTEDKDIAIAFAGLPEAIAEFKKYATETRRITFIRRAKTIILGNVSISETKHAFIDVFEQYGKNISNTDAGIAANATYGYPFMIQLVGFYIWLYSGKDSSVTPQNVSDGIKKATRDLEDLVLGVSIDDLSKTDLKVLLIMLKNPSDTKTSQIAEELGNVPQYAQEYIRRLISAGFIKRTNRGFVDFALPYFREYLNRSDVLEKLEVLSAENM